MQSAEDLVEHTGGGLHHVLEDGGDGHGSNDVGGEHDGLHQVVEGLVLVQEHTHQYLQHQTNEHRDEHEDNGVLQCGEEQLIGEDVLIVVKTHKLLGAQNGIPLHEAQVDTVAQSVDGGDQSDDHSRSDQHIGILQGAVEDLIGRSVLLQFQLAEGADLSLVRRRHGIRSPPLRSVRCRYGSGRRRSSTAPLRE